MFASIIISGSIFDVTVFILNELQHFHFLLDRNSPERGLKETGEMLPLDKEGLFWLCCNCESTLGPKTV